MANNIFSQRFVLGNKDAISEIKRDAPILETMVFWPAFFLVPQMFDVFGIKTIPLTIDLNQASDQAAGETTA